MPLPAAVPVTLTAAERKTLKKRVRGAKTCWRDRQRAQIVLAAARGRDNARIAADAGADGRLVARCPGVRMACQLSRGRSCGKQVPENGKKISGDAEEIARNPGKS